MKGKFVIDRYVEIGLAFENSLRWLLQELQLCIVLVFFWISEVP